MKRVLCTVFCIMQIALLCIPAFAANDMPYWYYQGDISEFSDFHGENLRRVVDDADILTDEQEQVLNARMTEVVEKYGIGYVLFTDNDNHGLTPEEYSSDFLHFGGYGVGDKYGAVVFYLCFDPSDRCWRTTSINSYESIFTQRITYEIDETVDADIRAGRYYEAFLKHIDFVESIFVRTRENLAEWYPEDTNTMELNRYDREFAETPALSNPRVIDNGDLLSAETESLLSEKLGQLSEKYKGDFIVYTGIGYNTLLPNEYIDDFYYFNGYGKDGAVFYMLGDDFSGTLYYNFIPYGERCDKYLELRSEILETARTYINDDRYDDAAIDYINNLMFVLKHNRMPMETKDKLICVAAGIIAGLIVGAICLAICRKGMKVVAPINATEYLDKGSFKLRDKKIVYLYSTVTKTAKPKSSGSSSGGGSSYSSGSSSGGSYSSGGRSF